MAPTKQPSVRPAPEKPPQAGPAQGEEDWDRVDEAAWESFPASDAPVGWAGKDRPLEERAEDKTRAPKPQPS